MYIILVLSHYGQQHSQKKVINWKIIIYYITLNVIYMYFKRISNKETQNRKNQKNKK